ncbi:MAG: beta-propeller domain-containing protein, partial [Dehalococcoidia bacterium]|nr:beta-propeller domain-containing protein [Dehalococcoidia bacterium]
MSNPKYALIGAFLLLTACSGGSGGNSLNSGPPVNSLLLDRSKGVMAFTTPLAAGADAVNTPATPGGGFAGTAPGTSTEGYSSVPVERQIEESDVYHLEGDRLFILNRYRGLQLLDISNLDAPEFLGRFPIYGQPKQMYLRGSLAYVLLSDAYGFAVPAGGAGVVPSYGSRILAVNVANPQLPTSAGEIEIEGEIIDSRIVGDMLYVIAGASDRTRIFSVAVGDPQAVRVMDTKDFPRGGWEHNACVTAETVYLASSGIASTGGAYQTRIRLFDIREPAGLFRLWGEVTVQGRVLDRWSLDEYQGVLRVATSQNWGNGDVYLNTFSLADPNHPAPLGSHTLRVAEQLKAARFDGPRGYLVSYRAIDPLFTFDLSDPARPKVLGELQMSGWLDFLVPLGDRVVSLGHEDVISPEGWRTSSLAVSLIDVSQSQTPTLLSRVVLEGEGGWVPGDRSDFAKVFRVLPEQNLILFPFQAWSPNDGRYVGGVQLIDLARDKLTRRGLIRDAGWVE